MGEGKAARETPTKGLAWTLKCIPGLGSVDSSIVSVRLTAGPPGPGGDRP